MTAINPDAETEGTTSMKKAFLSGIVGIVAVAGIVTAVRVIPAMAQTTPTHALLALGIVFNGYQSDTACHNAGDAITTNANGGTYHPNYYCIPMTNTTATLPVTGGGFSGGAF